MVIDRAWTHGNLQIERIPAAPILAAADEYKRVAASAAGYTVAVWIDDRPGTIEPPAMLP